MDTTASLLSELPSLVSSTPGSPRPASPVAPTVPTDKAMAANLTRDLMNEKRKKDKEAKKETARRIREEAERNKPPVLPPFRVREWVDIPPEEGETVGEGKKVSIFSWNVSSCLARRGADSMTDRETHHSLTTQMLAQALVKRDLFPNSDFLKSKDRVPALMKEVVHYSPDVVCLQEVDRLSDHLPILSLTHSHSTFTGYPSKSHCLLIASKKSVFTQVKSRGFRLDELPIDDSGLDESDIQSYDPTSEVALATPGESTSGTPPLTESGTSTPLESLPVLSQAAIPGTPTTRKSIGLSRSTRNVALAVALKFKDREGGLVVATTHLYWHPMFCYERVRQLGVLMREVRRFRDCADEGAYRGWEVVVAGDFNTQPREITYQLLLRNVLSPSIIGDLTRSRVVHQSVDKFYDPTYVPPVEEESIKKAAAESIRAGDSSQHPDKVIRNSRTPEEGDGLAELEELKRLFGYGDGGEGGGGEIRSAYGENYGKIPSEESNTYIDRTPEVASGSGWVIKEDPEVVRKRKLGTREEKIKRGDWEPKWTNFTPLWRCTLDYIFILPPSTVPSSTASPTSTPTSTRPPIVTSLLAMHPTEVMGAGLPKKGVEPSDHVAVGAVLEVF